MITFATIILLFLIRVSPAHELGDPVIIGQNVLYFGRDKFPSYWRDVEEWSNNTGIFNGSKPENSDKNIGMGDSVIDIRDCGGCDCPLPYTLYCGCVGTVRNCRVVMENTGGNIESCDTQSCTESFTYTQTQTVSNTLGIDTEVNIFDKMKIGGKYEITYSDKESYSDTKGVTLAKGESCTWISLKAYVECDVYSEKHCTPSKVPRLCSSSGRHFSRTTKSTTLIDHGGIINCYKPTTGVGTNSTPSSTFSNVLVVQP